MQAWNRSCSVVNRQKPHVKIGDRSQAQTGVGAKESVLFRLCRSAGSGGCWVQSWLGLAVEVLGLTMAEQAAEVLGPEMAEQAVDSEEELFLERRSVRTRIGNSTWHK